MGYSFSDSQAQALLARHSLAITDVLPMYLELRDDLLGGYVSVNPNDEGVAVNAHAGFIRKFVSVAVIYHELATRDALELPLPAEVAGQRVRLRQMTITREIPKSACRLMASHYESVVASLQADQQKGLSALLND